MSAAKHEQDQIYDDTKLLNGYFMVKTIDAFQSLVGQLAFAKLSREWTYYTDFLVLLFLLPKER